MRMIREVLRLRFEARLSARQIAASLKLARSTVGEYERRLAALGPMYFRAKAEALEIGDPGERWHAGCELAGWPGRLLAAQLADATLTPCASDRGCAFGRLLWPVACQTPIMYQP
jgi:transcriptional regulator with XRE-family HTH domain